MSRAHYQCVRKHVAHIPRHRVALVTCASKPALQPDDAALVAPLAALGIEALPAVWDDPSQDWSRYDLVLLRSPWDYIGKREEFLAWAESVPTLANPAELVRWNTDKVYLRDLAAAGVRMPETAWLAPGDSVTLPTRGQYVVKPSVGAGGSGAALFGEGDEQAAQAHRHVQKLLGYGRTVLIQPYVDSVDTHGETALIYFAGAFSHAVRKRSLFAEQRAGGPAGRSRQTIEATAPTGAELATAQAVLAAVPGGERACYARVDLIAGPHGQPLLLEVELAEPALFLGYSGHATRHFAAAIASYLHSARLAA